MLDLLPQDAPTMPKTSMKTYRIPSPDGPRQVTFKELQAEAVALLTHVATQPLCTAANRAAHDFSEELFNHCNGGRRGDSYAALLMAAWRLSMATEEAAA